MGVFVGECAHEGVGSRGTCLRPEDARWDGVHGI
jgi:hypothetical protein